MTCPKCGYTLAPVDPYDDKDWDLVCDSCGYVEYVDPYEGGQGDE